MTSPHHVTPSKDLLLKYRMALRPGTLMGRAYAYIRSTPSAAHELQQPLALSRRSASAICGVLHMVHLIQPSGLRRINPRGHPEIVWKATDPVPPPPHA